MNVKPCPFCGEDAVIEYGAHGSRSFPMCSNKLCPAGKGGTFDFERWNMRPIEDGLRAENDRLRAAANRLAATLRIWHDNGGFEASSFEHAALETVLGSKEMIGGDV